MEPFCLVPSSSSKRKKVLLTGFSSCTNIEENASWKAVNHMDLTRIQIEEGICLTKKAVPVVYEKVDKKIPTWLSNLQPHLTIHVGISPLASCFVLETQARRKGYELEDSNMCRPLSFEVPSEDGRDISADTLVTQLDVGAICRQFNSNRHDQLQAKISSDAGRYLCEYIYYTSLWHSQSPTLFIHVPINKYNTSRLVTGLKHILKLCLKQTATLKEDDCYSDTEE